MLTLTEFFLKIKQNNLTKNSFVHKKQAIEFIINFKILLRMKKLLFVLIAVLSVALAGCSAFDSNPVEPKIIGTTFLQEEKGLIFAEFDSVRYVPTIVYTGEKVGRDGIETTIKPIIGMQVTAFTSNIDKEPVFFAGQVTVEQIEQFYHKNFSLLVFVLIIIIGLILMCVVLGIAEKQNRKIPVINADA